MHRQRHCDLGVISTCANDVLHKVSPVAKVRTHDAIAKDFTRLRAQVTEPKPPLELGDGSGVEVAIGQALKLRPSCLLAQAIRLRHTARMAVVKPFGRQKSPPIGRSNCWAIWWREVLRDGVTLRFASRMDAPIAAIDVVDDEVEAWETASVSILGTFYGSGTESHNTRAHKIHRLRMQGEIVLPRETPKMMMVVDGDILLAAATCPPAAVVEHLFKTLLRVRQAEFEAQEGVNNPDAWDTGAAEPGVAIDVTRHLEDEEFGNAYARWRQQWLERITLYPWQVKLRLELPHHAYVRSTRAWFEAWLHKYLGNRHVARAVIRYGTIEVGVVTRLLEAIENEKTQVAEEKKRKREAETHGAAEPVWRLKLNAHLARKALREGESLQRKILSGNKKWEWLSLKQRQLLDDFAGRRLHVQVDRANTAYGDGIARTNDFGFRPGENMCRDIPIEVRAHLRTLHIS